MYYRSLDGLRGVAAVLVVFSHFFTPDVTKHLFIGVFGVNIFFTLSGFLITKRLLEEEVTATSRKQLISYFYINRLLRIFPIYFLYLGLCFIIYDIPFKERLFSVIYVYNYFQMFFSGHQVLQHLWSLSVEEQFYLFWPFIIVTVRSSKFRLRSYVLLFVISVLASFYTPLNPKSDLLSCAQFFCLGAILAHFKKNGQFESIRSRYAYISRITVVLSVGLFFLLVICSVLDIGLNDRFYNLITGLISIYVIAQLTNPANSAWRKVKQILENRPLVFLGKISYGVYLYHLLIGYWIVHLIGKLTGYLFLGRGRFMELIHYNNYIFDFPLVLLFSILGAYISYCLIEKPILKLKRITQ